MSTCAAAKRVPGSPVGPHPTPTANPPPPRSCDPPPHESSGPLAIPASLLAAAGLTLTPSPDPAPPTIGRPARSPTPQTPTLTGFTARRASWHLACEQRFLELPRSGSFREHLRTITEHPHPSGSAAQVRVGEYIAQAMERAGLEVTRYPYDV